ncbi:hypothetical protein [Streptomyces sp. DT171]|uniref:hypothetical protein n=1 Tax=Streptomyces sp. DT171 TaxID=3416524 RepID=UPI003CEC6EDB
MAVPATLWQPGMRITDIRLAAKDYQAGQLVISFTTLTSYTTPVVFPQPFPVAPIMNLEIVSGAGSTGRFEARPISITPSGFTLFILTTDAAQAAGTWSGVPVHWTARMPT